MASGVARRFRRLSMLQKGLILGGVGLGLGVITAAVAAGRRRRAGYTPGVPGQGPLPGILDLLDYDEEEVDEPEPDDIEYADEAGPCVPPPKAWDVPVAAGLESAEFCVPATDLEPLKKTDVAFALGGDRPRWPLDTNEQRKLQVSYEDVRGLWHGRWGRDFGASRKGKTEERFHTGVDLFADDGDVVVAMEDGEIIATLPFYKGTGALYQLTDSGVVINYGEIEYGSWKDFGLKTGIHTGDRVKAGQPIARVGQNNTSKHTSMLHLETYTPDVTIDEIRQGDLQWAKDTPPPENIMDPTRYLVRAQRVRAEEIA